MIEGGAQSQGKESEPTGVTCMLSRLSDVWGSSCFLRGANQYKLM